MIASHNTFSYLKSNWYWEIISPWWRCQNLSIEDQYSIKGFALIDIRVNIDKHGVYRLCHGSIKFGPKFNNLYTLIQFCISQTKTPPLYRLLFANKVKSLEECIKDFNDLTDDVKSMCHSCIYQPSWKYIYEDEFLPDIVEHNKHMWYSDKSFWYNIFHFLIPTIKQYAKKNNPNNFVDKQINMYDYIQY